MSNQPKARRDMHTVCLLSLKGGAGKSTVVQSLAVCAVQQGQNTLVIELDPQGSLKNWSKRRINEQPRVMQTLPQSLDDMLEEARENDVHWVFLDTPGHDTSTAAAAAAHADIILIPCKIQSMKDFDAVMATLTEANRVNKPAYVLMNQVPPNSPRLIRNKQVEIQREYNVTVLSKFLSRRVDFEYCDAKGLSAAEFNPDGAAAEETQRLFALIQSIFIALRQNGRPRASVLPPGPPANERAETGFSTIGGQRPGRLPPSTPSDQAVALPRGISLDADDERDTLLEDAAEEDAYRNWRRRHDALAQTEEIELEEIFLEDVPAERIDSAGDTVSDDAEDNVHQFITAHHSSP